MHRKWHSNNRKLRIVIYRFICFDIDATKSEVNAMTEQSTTALSWRDGDVYFWRYRKEGSALSFQYHCRAQKAIIASGMLADIYWAYIDGHHFNISNIGGSWTSLEQANRNILLEYKGNLDEFDVIPDHDAPLYDAADILDLRHANSSQKQIYLRKGAVRSRARMLEQCRYLRKKAESAMRSAEHNVAYYAEIEAKIEASVDLKEIYL